LGGEIAITTADILRIPARDSLL